MKIDVTMPATWRPELLERTLSSFYSNLFCFHRKDLRLIMNVDPIGAHGNKLHEIKLIARKFFDDIHIIAPERPSFATAFNKLWSMAETDFVFYLEEDWVLTRPIDFGHMVDIMRRNSRLAHLRLNKFTATEGYAETYHFQFPWSGEFYECLPIDKPSIAWCGHPSINSLRFVKEVISKINPKANPEKQIKRCISAVPDNTYRYGIFSPRPCDTPCVQDIGRAWMKANNFTKKGGSMAFDTWEKL